VAVFIEVIPQVKQRQIRQVIKAYETWRRDKTQTGGDQP
jgi:hypothetical protein